jgi:hypothetical protein
VLLVDAQRGDASGDCDRVVCHSGDASADLPFDVPRFDAELANTTTFKQLSDQQLHQYRDHLRRRLDRHVDQFNPHVIHVQYVGVWGQLAVETGVPYVVSAWGPELAASELDARYAPLAEQAAANAGRILVADEATLRRLSERFELDPERALVAPQELGMSAPEHAAAERAADVLAPIYQSLLDELFGSAP